MDLAEAEAAGARARTRTRFGLNTASSRSASPWRPGSNSGSMSGGTDRRPPAPTADDAAAACAAAAALAPPTPPVERPRPEGGPEPGGGVAELVEQRQRQRLFEEVDTCKLAVEAAFDDRALQAVLVPLQVRHWELALQTDGRVDHHHQLVAHEELWDAEPTAAAPSCCCCCCCCGGGGGGCGSGGCDRGR